MSKSLIIGARGLVGTALVKCLPNALQGVSIEPETPKQVYTDLAKYESLFKVFADHRPNVVYLPGAITAVDKCEDYGTNIVNVRGATYVLRLCEQFESKLVFYSSSYVFDGDSKTPYSTIDDTRPINNYGKQKEIMENLILESDAEYVIIRTVGIFGEERTKNNFAKQVISAIFAGRKAFVPNDQVMNPILSNDLARISVKLAEKEQGLFHVAGDECLTKYEFAKRIAKYFDLEKLVIPLTSEEMKQRAPRPKMGCLSCEGLRDFDIKIPSLEAGLLRFLEMEYNG